MTRTARAACPTCDRSTATSWSGADRVLHLHRDAATGKTCRSSSRSVGAELARIDRAAVRGAA